MNSLPLPTEVPDPAEEPGPAAGTKSVVRRAGASGPLNRYGLLVIFALVVAFFSAVNPDVFATGANARTIALTHATTTLVALAVTMPMITGNFDLSVGFQFGFAQAFLAVLTMQRGWPPLAALAVVVLTGAVIGLVNGLLITRLKLASFTTTIASGILIAGLTQWITDNQIIAGRLPNWFLAFGRGSVAGIPLPFLYVVLAAGALLFLTERTVWGRSAYATGDNSEAARLSGINTSRITTQSFVVSGVLCAVAGSVSVSTLGASSPVVGLGILLPAFAGAFLGSTSVRPGRYNVLGTVIAIYLVGAGISGLQQLGAASFVEQLFNGAALLIAIVLASFSVRRGSGR